MGDLTHFVTNSGEESNPSGHQQVWLKWEDSSRRVAGSLPQVASVRMKNRADFGHSSVKPAPVAHPTRRTGLPILLPLGRPETDGYLARLNRHEVVSPILGKTLGDAESSPKLRLTCACNSDALAEV
jgi:hypothetical protein